MLTSTEGVLCTGGGEETIIGSEVSIGALDIPILAKFISGILVAAKLAVYALVTRSVVLLPDCDEDLVGAESVRFFIVESRSGFDFFTFEIEGFFLRLPTAGESCWESSTSEL